MKNPKNSAHQLFKAFPDAESARKHFEQIRWAGTVSCPECKSEAIYSREGKRLGMHDCRDCGKHFSVRTGTVFEKSHIDLHRWMHAIYILVTAEKGFSSLQLSKEIGCTQKSAWFMLHRLRLVCGGNLEMLSGIVGIDETHIGGKKENKHASKKAKTGRGTVGKQSVTRVRERGGKVKTKPIKNKGRNTMQREVHAGVKIDLTVYTGDHRDYAGLGGLWSDHKTIKNSLKEFADDEAHTNGVGKVWVLLKRSYHSAYYHFSAKHLGKYVNEVVFRLNKGSCGNQTAERLHNLLANTISHRLAYAELTR